MAVSLKTIINDARELSPVERARLIDELLSTFELSGREEIDRLWAEEVESRIDAYKKDFLSARPVVDVLKEINGK